MKITQTERGNTRLRRNKTAPHFTHLLTQKSTLLSTVTPRYAEIAVVKSHDKNEKSPRSRLLTRILADDAVVEIVRSYFIVPEEMSRGDPVLARIFVEQRPEWVCWKTGLELKYMDSTLFSLKQVLSEWTNLQFC